MVLAVAAAVVAAADYAHQHVDFMRQMRMSRQELLDELKQSDGDPHVKQRLRALRLQRARRRMIADVPRATVVVTNPTHFAVALRYVAGETAAPEVLAKGVDTLALKIRKIAAENGIPVIENAAAGPRPARRLRHRRRDPGGPLPGGGRDHLLRAAAGRAAPARLAVPRCDGLPSAGIPEGFVHQASRTLASMQTPRAGRRPPKHGAPNLRRLAQAVLVAAVGVAAHPVAAAPVPLFGTAEFRVESLAELPQWQRVLRRAEAEEGAVRACAERADRCPNRATRAWAALLRDIALPAAADAGRGGPPLRQQRQVPGRFRQLRPQRLLGDAAGVLPPLRRLRGLRHRQVPLAAAARHAGRPAADGGRPGRGPRPAACRARGLSRR